MEIYVSKVSGLKPETMLKYIFITVIFHHYFEPWIVLFLFSEDDGAQGKDSSSLFDYNEEDLVIGKIAKVIFWRHSN